MFIDVLTWCGEQKALHAFFKLVLCFFYRQRVSIVLQREHAIVISRTAIIVGESSSRLKILSSLLPLSLVDMFHATKGRFSF
jgi:hypothetical protein